MSQLTKQQLKGENQTQFPNNNVGAITPSHLRAFNVDMIDSTVNQTDFTNFSGSVAGQFASATGSVTSAITASSLITASFDNGTRNLTFTKGDASTFAVNIPDVSGSTFNTASFATTGSNTFTGNQTINAELILTSSKYFRIGASQSISEGVVGNGLVIESQNGLLVRNLVGAGNITLQNTQGDTTIIGNRTYVYSTGDVGVSGSRTLIQDVDFIPFSASLNTRINNITGSGGSINTGSFATTGSNFFVGIEAINEIPGTGVGEVYLLGRSGSLFLANQLSAGGGPSYASISHISSSQLNANTNLIFKPTSTAGSTIVSGSNNIFTNPNAPTANFVRYVGGSGNIYLSAAGVPQITGSAASISGNRPIMNNNILNGTTFNITQASNPGVHTYSNNMINSGLVTLNTFGNTGTVNFNNNIGANPNMTINSPSASVANVVAGVSGSNGLTMQNNMIAGNFQYQGPVSSSTHFIQANNINGGLFLQLQSGSRTYNVNNNSIAGNLNIDDFVTFAPTLGSVNTIANNVVNGNVFYVNQNSASIQLSNNNLNGLSFTNQMDASAVTTATQRSATATGNALFGTGNNVLYSGSLSGVNARIFNNNILIGNQISASLVGDGNAKNINSTAILGRGLNVYGTSANFSVAQFQNYGGAFVGRWNAEDGNRASTAETIFAVGTGVSGSTGITRKTGFLIDSGSNTFIEGTLNVSGSTTITGSLSVTNLIVSGSTQFNGAQYSSLVTQSGSANVSQSITFDTTGPQFGVSLVDNTKLTVANSGTYNIQFSAQLLADTGADNVYIWFKKNGINIAGSASELAVSNNDEALMTVNLLDTAVANDYYELCWQTTNGDAVLLAAAATGNIPSIPSIITTITQVR